MGRDDALEAVLAARPNMRRLPCPLLVAEPQLATRAGRPAAAATLAWPAPRTQHAQSHACTPLWGCRRAASSSQSRGSRGVLIHCFRQQAIAASLLEPQPADREMSLI